MPSRPAIYIRPATRADLPAIVAMRDDLNALELAGCPHAAIQPLTLAEFTDWWGASFDDPRHCWRIVEVDGEPAGFGLIYLTTPLTQPPGAFVHWAYLKPAVRGQGLGRLLFDHLMDWARARGVNRIELQFVDGNTGAERFWTAMGFRPYARKCVLYPNAGNTEPD